ncbi:MAG: hypothetical protein A2402_00485 [Candidatus Staskawiczbacteria bacterium RIFOXYC1_FULL_37_43]|nr:MAG: hypothetical protein A2813_00895 [Candidatus Staskawiczbacteria bacterium RIFCSPHIGHO2_01_FULL_37_17]OGZ72336.1 MAG: hypothetical protein A2891_03665 [Candidatus Staskawiczbacteria bacterium RIFCSPLOWO2_01_FULL_37_19]OGZ76100.1 MAG: hypothetical protein A2205_03555 [Candidatus Staskawiczbacteria bacterium RIFOXYA1_FULL_37_15]OGZ77773.1 MAG: hypothetical protein A2280_03365 [Candidatus Staskawiczbacteria bacterium RIFOXYA12_FULL_37_10]OGZ80067.1 MAG: hypothetical protein A2353_02275 [Can
MNKNSETKICQNCKKDFVIEPDDFAFYEKIKVPAPTWCPECRFIRRVVWRNERTLYRRTCDLCRKNIISIYSPKSPYAVYCNECYHGDKWDTLSFGREYDFSRPFFDQFRELQLRVPRLYSFIFQNTNSEYVNGAAYDKNCYMIFVSDNNEDSLYSYSLMHSRNAIDCHTSNDCELCYECIGCKKCYMTKFSEDCTDCRNVVASKNCSNCQDCVGCVNLKNKNYYIFNKPYTKEEYLKKIEESNLQTREGMDAVLAKANKFFGENIAKYMHGIKNVNVVGDYVFNSKNSFECYGSNAIEDSKYLTWGDNSNNCHDGYVVVDKSSFSYEIVSAINLNNVKFSFCVWNDYDCQYCDNCENSNNLFGCVGIKKAEYCILNKQYTKEEYEELLPKIIKHMNSQPYTDKSGIEYKYGSFFPASLAPFAYNETAAQEYSPKNKEQAERAGYFWREPEERNYKVTLSSENVPNIIEETQDTILNEVIGCEHSGKCNEGCSLAFKIIPEELQLYRKLSVPVPKLCFNCRHMQRFKKKNPQKLWHRKCMKPGCTNKFETSYAPDRPEIVYCEKCYQQEVA